MAALKVFGATTTPSRQWGAQTRQVRVIVAATSQRAAVEALNAAGLRITLGEMRTYWSQTGNDHELAAATVPGQVLWADEQGIRSAADYREVPRG